MSWWSEKGRKTWIIHAQEDLSDDALYRFRRLGLTRTSYGIITVSQRMNKWIRKKWHPPSFALIPSRHLFAEFIFKAVHDRDYAGTDDTLAKILSIFFYSNDKIGIRRVKSKCVVCRKNLKSQELNKCSTKCTHFWRYIKASSPIFCGLDLFEPLVIRDIVKKRTHGKDMAYFSIAFYR